MDDLGYRGRLLASLEDALDSLIRTAAGMRDDQDTAPTVCADWAALDLLRHVRSNVATWLEIAERAAAGNAPAFLTLDLQRLDEQQRQQVDELRAAGVDVRDMHEENARGVASLQHLNRTALIDALRQDGVRYVDLLRNNESVDPRYQAVELHLHAHDLARAVGGDHYPSDEGCLLEVWALDSAAITSWPELVTASGRTSPSITSD